METFSMTDKNLFTDVRGSRLTDRGLYVGHDPGSGGFGGGDIYCVLADACFYDLEVYVPTDSSMRFSESARSATASGEIRAIVNGQVYDPQLTAAGFMWQGDVVENGVVRYGVHNKNETDLRYLGKWAGRTDLAYDLCKKGLPSRVTPPFRHAISNLLPIIRNGNPFSIGPNAGDDPAVDDDLEYYSPTLVTARFTDPPAVGKVIYGIHRATQLLCFFVQPDRAAGFLVADVVRRLHEMGVDDAVMGDGSDSASLVVDGQVLALAGPVKDLTIPSGLQLRRQTLSAPSGTTTFERCDDVALSLKLGALPSAQTDAVASLSWETSGPALTVTSFGGGLSAADLRLDALPIALSPTTPGNNLVEGIRFGSGDGDLTIDCSIVVSAPTDPGRLSGTFTIEQPLSPLVVSGSIDWPLA